MGHRVPLGWSDVSAQRSIGYLFINLLSCIDVLLQLALPGYCHTGESFVFVVNHIFIFIPEAYRFYL